MRLTKRQLKRIIREEYSRLKRRGLIREMNATDYPSGTSFDGLVTLEIDGDPYEGDMPTFDINEFRSFAMEEDFGPLQVEEQRPGIYHITGPFDQLWSGWVNCCGDEPDEFMMRVIDGQENCPEMEY